MKTALELQTRYHADPADRPARVTAHSGNESDLTYGSCTTFGGAGHIGRVVAMNQATAHRPAANLAVEIRTATTAVVEHHTSTAPADRVQPALVAAPTGDGITAHRARRVATSTSRFGRHVDGALAIALLAPPALIGLLMALGLQFAVAVCVMFAIAFTVTTSEDAMWMWRRHTDRESDGNPDW